MAGARDTGPHRNAGGSANKKSSNQKKQTKQLIIMAVMLIVCAALITWTVLLMKEKIAQQHQMTEQDSMVDLVEMSRGETSETSEVTYPTEVPEFTAATTTATASGTGDTSTTATTMTHATAPKRVTVQTVSFSRVTLTSTKAQHTTPAGGKQTTQAGGKATTQAGRTTQSSKATAQTTASTAQTTHTDAQKLTPNSAPTAAQLPFNELLALYLGAQAQGDSAYFSDGDVPTVILHGDKAYRIATAENDYAMTHWLGGTGGTDENPWQTDKPYTLKAYQDGDPYIYYTSNSGTGGEYQVIGYYNCKTGENIWARLHYYQVGVGWQAEYHIMNSQNGTATELFTSTSDAEALYESNAAIEQLEKELQSRGMSAGSWNSYVSLEPNQQSDALWSKAGEYNKGFAPQSGETCGAVSGTGNATVYSAANTTSAAAALLPAGTLLSIPKNAVPVGTDMVPVKAKVDGTWVSGYMQPQDVLAWAE
ncbi:MAG: hypothetical protein J5722_10555 [Oscillospiraceae bacterium]|nr:hypothetical protein [Oscillospiraceae bacterium]